MAELPAAKRARYSDMGLPRDDVLILAEDLETAEFFDAVLAEGAPAKLVANWVNGDIMAHCKVHTHCLLAELVSGDLDISEAPLPAEAGQEKPALPRGEGGGGGHVVCIGCKARSVDLRSGSEHSLQHSFLPTSEHPAILFYLICLTQVTF